LPFNRFFLIKFILFFNLKKKKFGFDFYLLSLTKMIDSIQNNFPSIIADTKISSPWTESHCRNSLERGTILWPVGKNLK
jgi:hypothetical protein